MREADGTRVVWWIAVAGVLGLAAGQGTSEGSGDDRHRRPPVELPSSEDEDGRDPGAELSPDEVCATGCSAASYPDGALPAEAFHELVAAWGRDPASAAGEHALDTLLFHGAQARALAWSHDFEGLAPARATYLTRELARDHALLSVRLVNATGESRLELPATRVPLGVKQHIVATRTTDLQPPEVSGTVKRVGLRHLWVRL